MRRLGLGILLLFGASTALAADAGLTARVSIAPASIAAGEEAKLSVEVDVPAGWHLWTFEPGEGPQPLTITVAETAPIEASGEWYGPEPHVVFDKGFERDLAQFSGGQTIRFERVVRAKKDAAPGPAVVSILLRGQICTEEQCIGQKHELKAEMTIAAAPTGVGNVSMNGVALTGRGTNPLGGQGILSFLLIAFLAGLGALATPCVFPAIPLTVSFFSKYSEESFGRGARLAGFYAISMVTYFTLAGVLISIFVGATGLQRFASAPSFNLALALVLVFFSLNLLGMFEIKVPAFMLNFTNRLEGKYGPAAMGVKAARSGLRDYLAVGVAAMTATTVFFTCTVAFVGVVVVAASKGEWFWPTIGMLAFSSAFVLPFFLLALFPQAAKRLRGKSGSWLNVTRVTLGFIELAAAVKFFSNADLVWGTNVIGRDAALAFWIALFALCGLFLLGKLKMGEEHGMEEVHVSVPRVLFSATTFAFALYLTLGLFSGRPLGWIDGWLPPNTNSAPLVAMSGQSGGGAASAVKFDWVHNLEQGRARASADNTLVFVNYTGFTCTNCRYMESSVFPLPEIAAILSKMTLVELYTDGRGVEYEQNQDDQIRRFGTAALPFYSVEKPDGTVIATFPSSTNDPREFLEFLKNATAKASPASVAERKAAPADETIKLVATRLENGVQEPAIIPGKWSLVNFWATWCGPCKEELKGFLAEIGRDFESKGNRFAAVAIEEDATVKTAFDFMSSIGVPPSSALRMPADITGDLLDARLGFNGEQLPYTVLVSPSGEVVWKHDTKLDPASLKKVLAEHVGYADLR